MEIAQDEIFALDRLPMSGSIVVAYSAEARARIQREIVASLGSEVAGKTKVVVVRDRLGVEERMTGLRKPVLLDGDFLSSAPPLTVDLAVKFARGINTTFRKR